MNGSTPPAIAPAESLIGRTFGEFVVRERLGDGGFGVVYRAEQPALQREAVIKVMHGEAGTSEVAARRFLREARLASRLDHPYAAHIYAFGAEPDGRLWIAMELVRGTPLDQLLREQGPIALDRLVGLVERLCEVVHTAHEQGIVHRDLKPANVMILSRAGRLLPKLLDLGIAKGVGPPGVEAPAAPPPRLEVEALDRTLDAAAGGTVPGVATGGDAELQLTLQGALMGSPHYMAPEQWLDAGAVDRRSDLYALGVLVYEALTGVRPFDGKTLHAIAAAHARKAPPALPASLPAALTEFFARALAKQPADRFASAIDLGAALRTASGLVDVAPGLPPLDEAVREAVLRDAPQPIAEAIASLEAARNVHQKRDALRVVVHAICRHIGLLAIASRASIGPERDSSVALEGLRALARGPLTDDQWLALGEALARPLAAMPEAHPIPELVELFAPRSPTAPRVAAALEAMLAMTDEELATTDDAALRARLADELAALATALRGLEPLWRFQLGAPVDDDIVELWTGVRRPLRLSIRLRGRVPEPGAVTLVTDDGAAVLSLAPVMQIAAPAPGAAPELFLFDGRGRRGAKLVALPRGFERHDDAVADWLRAQLATTLEPGSDDTRIDDTPYRGLSPFTAADASLFFGREALVDAVSNRLKVSSLLAIVGPSGAGKSSFVHAGLVPALTAEWQVVTMRPGSTPVDALAARLPAEHGPLLLIVDQFEEVFTLASDDQRERFAASIAALARRADGAVKVVLTLRDDFLLRAEALAPLRELLAAGLQLVSAPALDDLRRILVEPARRSGYRFEVDTLPDQMVAEVVGQPGALALLSFTALKLWELRDRQFRLLTERAFRALGGVGGALAGHAEQTLEAMHPDERRLTRDAFRKLVTAEGTRASLRPRDLHALLGDHPLAGAVIERLVAARLLVVREDDTGVDRIEIVHEALLTGWPRLVEWRSQDADGVRLRDRLRAAVQPWLERGRPAALLWRDDVLVELTRWRTKQAPHLTDDERAFADASAALARRTRRTRVGLLAAAFAVLVAGVVVLLVMNRRTEHQRERAEAATAESQRRLADQLVEEGRIMSLADQPSQALIALTRAARLGVDGPALRLLIALAARPHEIDNVVLHGDAPTGAGLSRDGARVLTSDERGTIRMWDATTGDELWHATPGAATSPIAFWGDGAVIAEIGGTVHTWTPDGAPGAQWSVGPTETTSASADGARIVTASAEGVSTVWSARGERLASVDHGAPCYGDACAILDDRGERLVTSSLDGVVKLWRVADGALVATLAAHDTRVTSIAFVGDDRLVTGADDGDAAIWRLPDGVRLHALSAHDAQIAMIVVAPDRKRFATISHDSTAVIWSMVEGQPLTTIRETSAQLHAGSFDPAGTRLATVASAGRVSVWDAATGLRLTSLVGHVSHVNTVEFSPDGLRLVTAGWDGQTRIWRLPAPTTSVSHAAGAEVSVVVISPDGALAVSGDSVGEVRQWRVSDGSTVATRRREPAQLVSDLAISPDGTVAVTYADGHLELLDAALRPRLTQTEVSCASFSADGAWLVTGSFDGPVRILDATTGAIRVEVDVRSYVFDVELDRHGARVAVATRERGGFILATDDGRELLHLDGPNGPFGSITFSPDERHVLSAHDEGSAIEWNARTGARERTLRHPGYLWSVLYSPDGALIVTTSADGLASVWDTATARLLATLPHGAPVYEPAFTPDGRWLATPSGDARVRLWDLARDARDVEALDELVRCRVPLRMESGVLAPAVPGGDGCP